MEDISWTADEEAMFSCHDVPKVNAA